MRLRLPALGAAAILLSAAPLLAFPPHPPLPPLPRVHVRVAPFAPPTPRHIVVTARPGPNYVWCDGTWEYQPSGYVWVDGRWALPPYGHARWVPPRYVLGHGGWHRFGGHWSHGWAGQREWHGRGHDSGWHRH